MTTVTLRLFTPLPAAETAPQKGMFARFIDALVEARMRKAIREIERYRHLLPPHL